MTRGANRIALFTAAAAGSLIALLVFADAAFAQGFAPDASFRCSGGHATGKLFLVDGRCPTSLTTTNFFSFLICTIEQLSSDLMGHMYCGLVQSLSPLVWACATLAVIIFGISFMIGLTSLGRGGAIMFAIKIAFVTALATNADVLIGVGYRFFISAMSDGIAIVVSGMGGSYHSASDVYNLLDGFLAKAFGMATDLMSPSTDAERCKNAVFAVIVTMIVAFPMLGYLSIVLVARVAMTFFRAVFGYIYAIIGITFLMILAPFFLCFYLFKQTQSFFQKWLAYLASFALQAVLLFTFMMFVLNINFTSQHLTGGISNLIMHNTQRPSIAVAWFKIPYCTLCDFRILNKGTGEEMLSTDKNLLSEGELQCKLPKNPITLDQAISPKPPSSASEAGAARTGVAEESVKRFGTLITLAAQGVLSLIVLAWMVERLLFMLPYLAQMLAGKLGANAAPQLGGGWAPYAPAIHAPGAAFAGDFAEGFKRGYGTGSNTVSGSAEGIKQGLSTLVTGRRADGSAWKDPYERDITSMGIGNRFKDWLSDPSK